MRATGKERDAGSFPEEWRDAGCPGAEERWGDAGSTPEERRVERRRSLWRRRMRVPPTPGERKDGRKQSPRRKDGGMRVPPKEERTEGYGERKARDAVPYWGKAALSP